MVTERFEPVLTNRNVDQPDHQGDEPWGEEEAGDSRTADRHRLTIIRSITFLSQIGIPIPPRQGGDDVEPGLQSILDILAASSKVIYRGNRVGLGVFWGLLTGISLLDDILMLTTNPGGAMAGHDEVVMVGITLGIVDYPYPFSGMRKVAVDVCQHAL